MYFLYCMFAYNKNYRRLKTNDREEDGLSESSDDEYMAEDDYCKKQNTKYETYTYNFLIKRILQHAPETATEKIRIIAEKWRLKSNENFLMSMLINRQDTVVNAYESFYRENQDEKLFEFCIKNHNEIYLKQAL